MSEDKNRRAEEDAEFERARELLERTVQFLSRCLEDPQAALKAEDPRELIRELNSLAAPRPASEEPSDAASEPRAFPIRRRRSA